MGKTQKATPSRLSPEEELTLIRNRLKHPTKEEVKYWLDTGSPRLNAVFGSETMGLPYGKQYEIAGWESHGKTSQVYELGWPVVYGFRGISSFFFRGWISARSFEISLPKIIDLRCR